MSHILSDSEVELALADLQGWSLEGDCLTRTYTFPSFRDAVSFIVRLSYEADEMNHHPELLNVYNRVQIRLTTHDVGGKVTDKDIKLARKIADACVYR